MSTTRRRTPIVEALSEGATLERVLDLADDAIEAAAANADADALAGIAEELTVLAERGAEWRRLSIAAARARALGAQAGAAPEAPASREAPEAVPRAALPTAQPAPPQAETTARVAYAGWWRRATAFVIDWIMATWALWATIVGGLVDVILAAADDRHRSLHDMIAGTIVVRTRLNTSVV